MEALDETWPDPHTPTDVSFHDLLEASLENIEAAYSGNSGNLQKPEIQKRRRQLIEDQLPAIIRRQVPSRTVNGSVGYGSPAAVPWVRVSSISGDPSAQEGYYLVYLFAADGSSCYLSLNQGTQGVRGGSSPLLKRAEDLWTAAGSPAGLMKQIKLKSDNGLPKKYEAGNAMALEYRRGQIPDSEQLFQDLLTMQSYLQKVESTSLRFNPKFEPEHLLLRWNPDSVIREHREIAEQRGEVWAGIRSKQKMASAHYEAIRDQLNMSIPTSMVVHSPESVYEADLLELVDSIDQIDESIRPQSYDAADCAYFIRLRRFVPRDTNWLFNNYVVASNPVFDSVEKALNGQQPFFYIYKLFKSEVGDPVIPQTDLKALEDVTFWERDRLEEVLESLTDESPHPQVILSGPPGTGKTFVAQEIAKHLTDGDPNRVEMVQFHPSYGYEEFVQGLRPVAENGQVSFSVEDGPIVRLASECREDGLPRVLIIDEMNRANLPRVFGELMFLLEYRDRSINLMHQDAFELPKNLYIIGTMNTADRSIRTIDIALRRRFDIFDCPPDPHVLQRYYRHEGGGNLLLPEDVLLSGFRKLNDFLKTELDKGYEIGHSYFMREKMNKRALERVWKLQIEPILREYFYDQREIKDDVFDLRNYFSL